MTILKLHLKTCYREADIERRDEENYTSLLLASVYGHAATVDLLIQKGADTSAVDKNDKTAIFLAAEENQLSCLEVGLLCLVLRKTSLTLSRTLKIESISFASLC